MSVIQSDIIVRPVGQSRLPEIDMDNIPFGREFSDHMLIARYEQGEWQTPEIVPYGRHVDPIYPFHLEGIGVNRQ